MVDVALTLGMISIALGITGIGLAVGMSTHQKRQEERRRVEHEKFFEKQIRDNLLKMAQYFLVVENKTTYNEDFDSSDDEMMKSLNMFYRRNEQEMKDILYQSKLYLPFWASLSSADRKNINKIFDLFSWLLYDYYPDRLPESIRKSSVLRARTTFHRNKNLVMNTINSIPQNTQPQT